MSKKFTTRVELHGVNHDHESYKTLHAEMRKEGFSTTIEDSKGIKYQLPTAEYNFAGVYTTEQVLDKAISAAAKTGKTNSILVTESNGRQWHNLPKVN